MSFFSKPNEQQTLKSYFSQREKKFWRKKKPIGKNYSYDVLDPYKVFGDNTLGYENLYLIGDNWLNHPNKPIAIIIGCNDWKFGFISDYLSDYRCAFGSRKLTSINMVKTIINLKISPKIAVIWGYNESTILNKFLKIKKIPIWRVEDGFIRSANLGAAHSTPYSLVFDKTGLYYNGSQPSDIENILNTYDFSKFPKEHASNILNLIRDFRISKYNPPIINKISSIKLEKTILVIGQVDNDASLKYGNPNEWTMEDIVRLARSENPQAEVLYRPHPEVYKGYQKTKFKNNNIKNFAKIISPDEHIIDLLDRVDHVYTLSSLTGLEALLRNKTVTVLGTPFYAGWGLTDDRCSISRRNKKLSLIELFIGTYLIYPKYLANNQNSYIGAMSSILKITADQSALLGQISSKNLNDTIESEILIANLLKSEKFKYDKKIITNFFNQDNSYLNLSIPILLISTCNSNSERKKILNIFQDVINIKFFNDLILLVNTYYPGDYLLSSWNNLLIKNKDFDAALELTRLQGHQKPQIVTKEYIESLLKEYEVYIYSKKFDLAKNILNHILLISDIDKKNLLKYVINLSNHLFDYQTSNKSSKLLSIIDIEYSNRIGILEEFRSYNYIDLDEKSTLSTISKLASFKPDKILYTDYLIDYRFKKPFSDDLKLALACTFNIDNEISIRKINGLISIGKYQRAQHLAFKLIQKNKDNISDNEIVTFTQALSYNNNISLAIELLEEYIKFNKFSKMTISELMRLYVLNSSYQKSLNILNTAISNGIEIGEMHRRKCYFGNKMIYNALETFKDLEIAKNLSIYFTNYTNSKDDLSNAKSIGFINIFGPGDEIRFASIYNKILKYFPDSSIQIGCSPRLVNLFSKSFPKITFIPVNRPRNGDRIELQNYSEVPGSDIHTIIDNNAISLIKNSEKISLITDMLSDFLKNAEDFSKSHYLLANDNLHLNIREKFQIQDTKKLIGLSWRSSLTTSARIEHYLTVQELESIFSIPNIQFINLQYDECTDEIDWINNHYPNKIINFENIDQYNDFDSVSSIMSEMDLIISPATTVAELAGALGIKTWLFSNSSEIDWRKVDEHGTDIWHNSIQIIDIPQKGNKTLLVKEIYKKLVDFSQE